MNTITCNYCHIEKPEDDYWPSLIRQKRCKPCHIAFGNGLKWTKWRSWVQKTWNITRKQFYNLPKDVRRERTAMAREALEDKVVSLVPPKPPKDNLPAAKPARTRTNLEPLDKLPPEGWVYIIAASRHASIMKIGSTFEYGIRDRLSEAKRWALAGSAVLLHKEWFSRCKQAESLVHKRLDYYRIVSPDAGDELFRTSFEHALANVMIIKNEVENDREKQEVG